MEMQEDRIMMKDGKVMIMRNGEMMPMEEGMTLSDGTRVMPNGQILMAEGETMNMDGQMVDVANMPDQEFKEKMEDEELRDDIK